MVLTAGAVLIWLVAGLAALAVPPDRAHPVRLALVVAGIPLLGLVTLYLGPLAGLAGLGLGTGVMVLHRVPQPMAPPEPE